MLARHGIPVLPLKMEHCLLTVFYMMTARRPAMTGGDQIEHRLVVGTSAAAVELGLALVCYTRLVVVVVVLELHYRASRYTPPETCTAPDTVMVRNL